MNVTLEPQPGKSRTYGYVLDHKQEIIGTYQQISAWPTGRDSDRWMQQVQVALRDGTEWNGRGPLAHPFPVTIKRKKEGTR